MALRFEISGVQHPFKLCFLCNEALGWIQLTVEPGHPKMRQLHVCHDDLPTVLHDLGAGIIRELEEAKRAKEDED